MKTPSPFNQAPISRLNKRMRELDCIYAVSNAAIKPDVPFHEIIQSIADKVPLGFQYPELTCARITAGDTVIQTANFRECKFRLEADITLDKKIAGKLEVGCFSPDLRTGSPFLVEEKKLLEAIIAPIGMVIQQKILSDAIEESEKQHRNLIDNALIGIYQTNVRGDIVYMNDTCLRMFGYKSLEEARLKGSPSRYQNQEDRKALLEILAQTGQVSNCEVEFVAESGAPIVALLSAVLDSDVITGMMMDITDRKRADEALRKSESLYRLLAENVSDVIWTMDMDLNFTYISPSVSRFRGIDAERALHQPLKDVVTHRSYEIIRKTLEAGLARKEQEMKEPFNSQVLELENVRNDGSLGWAEVKVSFLRDSQGSPTGILGVSRDITHRKEAENELRMKSLRLEEVNTALKVLLEQREEDRIELEDKILFNVRKLILPYLDTLKKRRLDDEQRTCLDVLETNLKNIVSPFAKRLTSVHEKFTPQEIKVADLIRDGKTVKEIAVSFGVSESAINLHRQHIRQKLGLNNQKINLRTYLLSLT